MNILNKPKKSLGQHFLMDENIARKIVLSLEVSNASTVLEIGAGRGILTKFLLQKTSDLWISEIDKNQINFLTEKLKNLNKNKILHGDILQVDFTKYFSSPIAIIGNLPYHISSPLLFKILQYKQLIKQTVCMLQKEVAKRICNKAGTKDYGKLSVLLQAFYEVEYLFSVSQTVFYPTPKVSSAVIRLKRSDKKLNCNEKLLFKIVKTTFNQRRKTIKNSLKSILGNRKVSHPLQQKRPEQLSVQDFVSLVNYVEPIIIN